MSISQEKRKEALDFLIKVGMLIPFDSLELYHGRSRGKHEEGTWYVDPSFNNSNNATGNRNINGISALAAADKQTAYKFAKARSLFSGTPEIHKIDSTIDNALIFNLRFKMDELSKEDKDKCLESAVWLLSDKTSK